MGAKLEGWQSCGFGGVSNAMVGAEAPAAPPSNGEHVLLLALGMV